MIELSVLQDEVARCHKCEIAAKRRNTVFGEGNPESPLMIIGEGPGDQEDATGRPFVGKAGKLLDLALADNQLDRTHVYICNTVKCRACDWRNDKPYNRPPTDEETANCRNWLMQQIKIIKPKVILCIGAPSAKNLIRKDFKITKDRGILNKSEYCNAILAALHPSYILRQQSMGGDGGYSTLVADIKKAYETAIKLKEAGK